MLLVSNQDNTKYHIYNSLSSNLCLIYHLLVFFHTNTPSFERFVFLLTLTFYYFRSLVFVLVYFSPHFLIKHFISQFFSFNLLLLFHNIYSLLISKKLTCITNTPFSFIRLSLTSLRAQATSSSQECIFFRYFHLLWLFCLVLLQNA
jgi:hypothetical protein